MLVVSRRVEGFDHNGRVGAFRNWLRTITVHAARKFLNKRQRQPEASGTSDFRKMLEQLECENSAISQQFNLLHDQFVLQDLLRRVSLRFQPSTIEAFRLHALEGKLALPRRSTKQN